MLWQKSESLEIGLSELDRTIIFRAYFNVPTGTDVLGDLKSVLEGLVTRA